MRILDAEETALSEVELQRLVVPWVLASGMPYFERLFGDPTQAEVEVSRWVERPSSELWFGRARLMVDPSFGPVGGYIAMSGRELTRCRKTDALMLVRECSIEEAERRRAFLKATAGLFAGVPTEAAYLSKIGLLPGFRGRGLGGKLLSDWLARMRACGVSELWLDVSEENAQALALYRRFGFRICRRETRASQALHYLSLNRQVAENGMRRQG